MRVDTFPMSTIFLGVLGRLVCGLAAEQMGEKKSTGECDSRGEEQRSTG